MIPAALEIYRRSEMNREESETQMRIKGAMKMKSTVKRILHAGVPVPGLLRPVVRMVYRIGVLTAELLRWAYGGLIAATVVKSVAEGGQRLRIERIPYMRGGGRIVLGSDIYISGKIGIGFSRHSFTVPTLKVGDRTFIGHDCVFAIAGQVTIGNDCLIAGGVRIQDNDGHPLDPVLRREGKAVTAENIWPVVIGSNVWIASRAVILKGVTIGDNSVVGAGAVVTKNVPSDSVVAGSPARVVRSLRRQEVEHP